MKKFYIAIFLFLLIIIGIFSSFKFDYSNKEKTFFLSIFDNCSGEKSICCVASSCSSNMYTNYEKRITNANKDFFYFSNFDFVNKSFNCFDYIEVALKYTPFQSLNLNNVVILFSDKYMNKQIIYAYSSCLDKNVYVKNFKVNLQIVMEDNMLFVGYPFIYTSY